VTAWFSCGLQHLQQVGPAAEGFLFTSRASNRAFFASRKSRSARLPRVHARFQHFRVVTDCPKP
jgi:hypothetical protein